MVDLRTVKRSDSPEELSMNALVRFWSRTGPELGSLEGGMVTPSGLGDDAWPTLLQEWAIGGVEIPAAGRPVPVEEVRLLPPLTDTSRIFCVAQNYPAHAAEAGGASPPTPIVFLKPPSAFVGHEGTALLPGTSSFFDYEGEIAVVVGRAAQSVAPATAMRIVAGYSLANDGSARDLQPATLADRFQVDWFAAKSFDNGSALGPGVVRATELPAPESFRLQTWHNGDLVQDDLGASMYHPVAHLLSFVSRIVSLRPGDIVLSGTPAGVGKARGVSLADGDTVTVAVDGLGALTTRYTQAPAAASSEPRTAAAVDQPVNQPYTGTVSRNC
jgi:2-keto-4-pentenoate hydratase/2-oxohepta-3-ene-1,7-dioic acid hydratase in catechol pathway